MKSVTGFSQLPIARPAVPIHRLDRLSEDLKIELYCLRDDLNGFAFGGNKNRKLNYLLADAQNKACDTLIAIGAQQSNFCRLAAAAGAFYGLEVHLVLSGEPPERYRGNLLLDQLVGANLHFVGDQVTKKKAWELEQQLLAQGRRPYRMPSGGSTGIGALGYVEAMQEITQFEQTKGLKFSKIFHASGSGGTQAGLVAGQAISAWPGEVIGVSVGREREGLRSVIEIIANETLALLEFRSPVEPAHILVDDNYVGDGYGQRTVAGEKAINAFARREGIFLDHVYSGKGAAGLLDYVHSGRIHSGEVVLFIHTGGNVQLFA